MSIRQPLLFLMLILLLALPVYAQAKRVYVSDEFKITLRSGPSIENKIFRMLPSGTRLEVIDETPAWYQVRTEDGKEGWILKRYSMDRLPYKQQARRLQSKIDRLEKEQERAEKTIADLKKENSQLSRELSQTRSSLEEVQQKYDSLRSDAKRINTIKSNYETAKKELERTRSRLQTVLEENKGLKSQISLRWFLSGAGVVGISAVIGFFLGRIQRKKSRSVYF
jgi:SH3 domain protein